MAIAVTDLGIASSTTNVATLTKSITVPAGAMILVLIAEGQSNIGTVSDATNGAYTALGLQNGQTNPVSRGFVFYNSNPLTGVTLTYTKGNSADQVAMSVFYATGIAAASAQDTAVSAANSGTSSFATVTSGTPAVAGELFVSLLSWATSNAPTVDPNWTALLVNTTPSTPRCQIAYAVNAGTGTLTHSTTGIGLSRWNDGIYGFKAASDIFVPGQDDTPSNIRPVRPDITTSALPFAVPATPFVLPTAFDPGFRKRQDVDAGSFLQVGLPIKPANLAPTYVEQALRPARRIDDPQPYLQVGLPITPANLAPTYVEQALRPTRRIDDPQPYIQVGLPITPSLLPPILIEQGRRRPVDVPVLSFVSAQRPQIAILSEVLIEAARRPVLADLGETQVLFIPAQIVTLTQEYFEEALYRAYRSVDPQNVIINFKAALTPATMSPVVIEQMMARRYAIADIEAMFLPPVPPVPPTENLPPHRPMMVVTGMRPLAPL